MYKRSLMLYASRIKQVISYNKVHNRESTKQQSLKKRQLMRKSTFYVQQYEMSDITVTTRESTRAG